MVKYIYDAWGNHGIEVLDSTCETLANLNPFRYRSYYYDTETELYFLKTRYYDPEIGRFMTIDGIKYLAPEMVNGLNLYAYCGNNPVMGISGGPYVDPNAKGWGENGEFNWWQKLMAGVAGLGYAGILVGLIVGLAGGAVGVSIWAISSVVAIVASIMGGFGGAT